MMIAAVIAKIKPANKKELDEGKEPKNARVAADCLPLRKLMNLLVISAMFKAENKHNAVLQNIKNIAKMGMFLLMIFAR